MNERPIPSEHEIARKAQHEVEGKLRPCIPTRLGEGDDYGLDAFVQHVIPGRPPFRTNLLFGLQVKGTGKELTSIHSEPLKVAHLIDWHSSQTEVVVAVHSVVSGRTRWRGSRDIAQELDLERPEWRTQKTVNVSFRERDDRSGEEFHSWLGRTIERVADTAGGKDRLHRSLRSVLLTELYHDYDWTGQHGGLAESPDGPEVGKFVTGMQWEKGEIDDSAVLASRVLTGALMLFEQIFFPAEFTYAAIGSLGPALFDHLLSNDRLVPVILPNHELAFVTGSEERGDLYFFNVNMLEVQDRGLSALQKKYGLSDSLATRVKQATRKLELPDRTTKELLEVSKLDYIRHLLGLGAAQPQSKEPAWAAERLLRIGNVVKFYSIAELLSVDIVEFEPGLARLALARWGSRVRFHRLYQALDELEATLRASALPDMGLLAAQIGVRRCVEISESKEGQDFRSWFWKAAGELISKTGGFENEVAKVIRSLCNSDIPLPAEFLVGLSAEGGSTAEGWASRTGGEIALERQKRFSAKRLRRELQKRRISEPALSDRCICDSGLMFGSCCGRVF